MEKEADKPLMAGDRSIKKGRVDKRNSRKDMKNMKKKVIALLMVAVMVTSMAACGDKEPEESVPVSGQAEQDDGQESSGEESGTEDSGMESNSKDTSDAAGENDDAGVSVGDDSDATESEPEGFDWASVDWDDVIGYPWPNGEFVNYAFLRHFAKQAIKSGKTKEDLMEGTQICMDIIHQLIMMTGMKKHCLMNL